MRPTVCVDGQAVYPPDAALQLTLMLLNDLDHPLVEAAQGHPGIRTGHAHIHIPEELFPTRISLPFLSKLTEYGVYLLFREHRCADPLHALHAVSMPLNMSISA